MKHYLDGPLETAKYRTKIKEFQGFQEFQDIKFISISKYLRI